MEIMTWANVASFGWIFAIALWVLLIVIKMKPQISIKKISEDIFWIVEEADKLSNGALKNDAKWALYRMIFLLFGKFLGHFSEEDLNKVKPVIEKLSEENKPETGVLS